jgi:hypothetical protein
MEKEMVESGGGQALIEKYKRNYNIPDSIEITEDMINRHWELEQTLAGNIINSSSQDRWKISEQSYTTLYKELRWLNTIEDLNKNYLPADMYRSWISLIGKPPRKVFEIGPGKSKMISYLASLGSSVKHPK